MLSDRSAQLYQKQHFFFASLLKRKLFDNGFDWAKVEAAVQIPEQIYNHPMMCIIISWMSRNRSG